MEQNGTNEMTQQAKNLQRNREREPLRFLVFSASLRTGSLNTLLAKIASRIINSHGGEVDFAEMNEFDCPSFNQDSELKKIIPPGAEHFHKRLLANDAFVISSPEYNASMPGLLKNAIDWVSRFRPQPFNERHALLMSASPSMAGGNKSLWSLRIPLEHLGSRVFPDMFSLASAHQAFNAEGDILIQRSLNGLRIIFAAFMDLVEAAKNYPCIKKAWVEFLGEQPDPVTERVE